MMLREFEDKENQMAELDEQVWLFWGVEWSRHFNWVVSKWHFFLKQILLKSKGSPTTSEGGFINQFKLRDVIYDNLL